MDWCLYDIGLRLERVNTPQKLFDSNLFHVTLNLSPCFLGSIPKCCEEDLNMDFYLPKIL